MGVLGQAHVGVASVFHSRTSGISSGQWYPRGVGGQLSDQGVCAAASTGGCYLFLILQITSLPEWDEDGYHSSEFSILLVKLLSVSIM